MSCPACQANTFAPHAPDCPAVYHPQEDQRLEEALRAYDAEVIGRRDEVNRLHGELSELRAKLAAAERERDTARESVERLADGLFTCDQLLQAEKAQLARVKLLNVMRARMNVFWALRLDETRAAWGREHTALLEARGDRDEFDRERCSLAKQLDRTLHSRKRLQARYDRARLVLKACEAPVWPIVSDQPLCADCRLGEDVP